MDIRLIAMDLDGTLLTTNRELHPNHVSALRRASEASITLCLASGRNVLGIRPYFEAANLTGPIVSSNGAYALSANGETLEDRVLDPGVARSILNFCRSQGIQVNAYAQDRVLMASVSEWSELYTRRVVHFEPILTDWDTLVGTAANKLLLIDHPAKIAEYQVALASIIPSSSANPVVSEPEYLEFLAPGVNKLTGVQAVARKMGLNRGQVAAIGDYENDLELVQWASYSGAVANAVPSVLEHATQVFASNDEGGVAEFIDSIVYNS